MFRLLFHKPHHIQETRYSGKKTDLIVNRKDREDGRVVIARFYIVLHGTMTRVGYCDLRLEMNREMYYAGNIGYRIFTPYRGNGYAYDATVTLLSVGFDIHGMDEIIITCSPENTASRRTIEKLGGELLETVEVPEDHWLYERGELVKNIYLFKKKDWER